MIGLVLHEWTSNTCASGPQGEDADNLLAFNVARATTYANSTLTTQQTTFAASTPLTGTVAKTSGGANTTLTGTGTSFLTQLAIGDTIAVPHAGGTDFRRVTAIATNTSLTVNSAWSDKRHRPDRDEVQAGLRHRRRAWTERKRLLDDVGSSGRRTSCANTSGGDRANSTATGHLPDAAPAYLEYVPSDSVNNWNRQSSYDTPNCAPFSASNQGTWKLTLARGNDGLHTVTFDLFSIDTAAPTVTINSAGRPGRSHDRLADPLHGHFSEAVTGFTSATSPWEAPPAPRPRSLPAARRPITSPSAAWRRAGPSSPRSRRAARWTRPATPTQLPVDGQHRTWDRVPATTTPTFNPSPPEDERPLEASTTTSDPDGDNISVFWTWFVSRGGNLCTVQTNTSASAPAGVRTVSLDLSANYVPTTCSGTMINPLNPIKGDLVIPGRGRTTVSSTARCNPPPPRSPTRRRRSPSTARR